MASPWKVFMDAFKRASTKQPDAPAVDTKTYGTMGSTSDPKPFEPIQRHATPLTPEAGVGESTVTGVVDAGSPTAPQAGPEQGDPKHLIESIYAGDDVAAAGLDPELVAAVRRLPQEDVFSVLSEPTVAPQPSGVDAVAQEVDVSGLMNQMLANILKMQAETAERQMREVRAREVPSDEDAGLEHPDAPVGPMGGAYAHGAETSESSAAPGDSAAVSDATAEPVSGGVVPFGENAVPPEDDARDLTTQSGTPDETAGADAEPPIADNSPAAPNEVPESPAEEESGGEDGATDSEEGTLVSLLDPRAPQPGESEDTSLPLDWGGPRVPSRSDSDEQKNDQDADDEDSFTIVKLLPRRPDESQMIVTGGRLNLDTDLADIEDAIEDDVDV